MLNSHWEIEESFLENFPPFIVSLSRIRLQIGYRLAFFMGMICQVVKNCHIGWTGRKVGYKLYWNEFFILSKIPSSCMMYFEQKRYAACEQSQPMTMKRNCPHEKEDSHLDIFHNYFVTNHRFYDNAASVWQ